MAKQLTLGVSLKDDATFANFYAGKNALLISQLQKNLEGSGERIIYLYGADGDGRTHLLHATYNTAEKFNLNKTYISLADGLKDSPKILQDIENYDLVCIDDLNIIAGNSAWEEAFFFAYNRMRDVGTRLIVSANMLPKFLGLQLKDLSSRLAWGFVYYLQPLTDEEKLQVLIMRANRRGMTLTSEVGKFMLTHLPRHMSKLFEALETLDNASLAEQHKLTIPFVKEVLQLK